jgi:hypothetical protein
MKCSYNKALSKQDGKVVTLLTCVWEVTQVSPQTPTALTDFS